MGRSRRFACPSRNRLSDGIPGQWRRLADPRGGEGGRQTFRRQPCRRGDPAGSCGPSRSLSRRGPRCGDRVSPAGRDLPQVGEHAGQARESREAEVACSSPSGREARGRCGGNGRRVLPASHGPGGGAGRRSGRGLRTGCRDCEHLAQGKGAGVARDGSVRAGQEAARQPRPGGPRADRRNRHQSGRSPRRQMDTLLALSLRRYEQRHPVQREACGVRGERVGGGTGAP
ncbi:MAG: hypothetical protein BWX47_01866 [candidate division Hyd24-12 bacterium ADurb.Bin004]|nr:MAG: hypothetical protein BWX47_01866 [candidate division Hyd24-12 bacterium ADurb.Bin004]